MIRSLIIFLLLFCSSVYGQKGRGLVKTNILNPFSLSFEYQFADKVSVQFGGWIMPDSLLLDGIELKNYVTEIKYYYKATEEVPARVYVGPYFGFTNVKHVSSLGRKSFHDAYSLGLNTGYLYPFVNNLIVEVYLGVGYKFYQSYSNTFYSFSSFNRKVEFRIGIVVGFKLFGPSILPEKL